MRNSRPGISRGQSGVVEGVALIGRLIGIRAERKRNPGGDLAERAMEKWMRARQRWWKELEREDVQRSVPLVSLSRRMNLSAREVDIVLIALSPLVDPELLEEVAARERYYFRGIDVELVLGLLFPTARERFGGMAHMAPDSTLVRRGLIQLVPFGSELNPYEMEVRATDSLASLVLERTVFTGPVARFCTLETPSHSWDAVILPEEQRERVWRIVSAERQLPERLESWGYRSVIPRGRGITLLFTGPPGTGKTAFAHAIADRLGRGVISVQTSKLLASREPIRPLLTDIFRIASLIGSVVIMDDSESLLADRDARFLAVLETLDQNESLLILTTNNAPRIDFAMARRVLYRVDFAIPPVESRHQIWEVHLPPEAPLSSDIDIETLAATYEFTGGRIRNSVLIALAHLAADDGAELTMEMLREAAETQLSARFDDLAVKSDSPALMDRLVLPDDELEQVEEVLAACRHHDYVLTQWGFSERITTGRGICILFDGPPGTGKTLTAEILANELKLPLYRVHIPNVVSKWVGETERNIAEIFRRARAARAMLLFDEADSLFGRRSSGQGTANERYANMEVNLLLQEVERYDGFTVLTTNLYGNLDEALQRRIQFRVTFPFPEPAERAAIWSTLMPRRAPVADDIDYHDLGRRFELSGGHIKNALLRAAYRARSDGDEITHRHLHDAAIAESKAQGRIVRAGAPKKK